MAKKSLKFEEKEYELFIQRIKVPIVWAEDGTHILDFNNGTNLPDPKPIKIMNNMAALNIEVEKLRQETEKNQTIAIQLKKDFFIKQIISKQKQK